MNNLVQGAINSPTDPKFPSACNWLQGGSFWGWPYTYRWSLGIRTVTPGTPAKAASGKPDAENFKPAQAAVEETASYTELANGNQSMSQAQWDAWTTQQTDSYLLQCVADNLGVTLIPATEQSATKVKKTTQAAAVVKRSKKKRARG